MGDQSLCTACSGCVLDRDGLWPARKPIYHSEKVHMNVHMNVVKLPLGDGERLKWGFDVRMDF